MTGYVWREAFAGDRVCVTPDVRDLVRSENTMAGGRREGATAVPVFTPPLAPMATVVGRCISGYVWRKARRGDIVCVKPASRTRVAQENRLASRRVNPDGPYGPATCLAGYVWRQAYPGDRVCVTPDIRDLVRSENALADSRRMP